MLSQCEIMYNAVMVSQESSKFARLYNFISIVYSLQQRFCVRVLGLWAVGLIKPTTFHRSFPLKLSSFTF